MHSPQLRGGKFCFISLRKRDLHKLFGIPCRKFVSSPLLIYLLNIYLQPYRLTEIYFILGIIIQYYCNIFHCLNCPSFSHWKLTHILCTLDMFLSFLLFSLSFSPLPFLPLLFVTKKCPQVHLVFSCPALESVTSPGTPGSFNWRMVFQNQDLCIRCDFCYCSKGENQGIFLVINQVLAIWG